MLADGLIVKELNQSGLHLEYWRAVRMHSRHQKIESSHFEAQPSGYAAIKRAVKLLQGAGLKFFQYPVTIDEEAIRDTGIAEAILPSDIVVTLAEMKAAVAAQHLAIENSSSPAYILGCDQVLIFDGMIYSKPKNIMTAKSQFWGPSQGSFDRVKENGINIWPQSG